MKEVPLPMTNQTRIRLVISAMCLAAAAPAVAGAKDLAVRSENVRTADINLMSDEGRSLLDARIRTAARHLCGFDEGVESLQTTMLRKSCLGAVLADANGQLNAILLGRGSDERAGATSMATGER